MALQITAGHTKDIEKGSGQWLIIDIGFSREEKTCGIWNSVWGDAAKPQVVTFGELVKLAIREIQKDDKRPLNLLIEAPLSVAFREDGNPARRICDSQGSKHRDWYVNAGATTLIAASWLLRELKGCQGQRDVKLFEGFVSFKPRGGVPKTKQQREASHKEDVLKLKKAVWAAEKGAKIFEPDKLRQNVDCIRSAFHFLDKDLIPPVIRVDS